MPKSENKKASLKNISKIQLFMILGYAVIVAVAVWAVSRLAITKTDETLKNKVISLTSSLNMQMKLNLESYLSRMETIATLAFGEENSYTYDATDPDNDEYEAIQTEKVITEKLYSLCIMENFVDYGIVYRNNRTVGKISNATSSLFGDRIFSELSSMISRPRTNDGWAAGYGSDYKRIYYVKKVHDNAVLVISFYASELDSVFDNPETLSDMAIRLVNRDYSIIYSEDRTEVGQPTPETIRSRIAGRTAAAVLDNDYLVSVNSCGEWYVVCSIPTPIILEEKNDMTLFIYITGLIAGALAVLVGVLLSFNLTRPIKKIVSNLDDKASNDLLTGVLNKRSFEEYAGNVLSHSLDTEKHALIILDLDKFKDVNDTLGHAAGDKVLENTGRILRETFTDNDYLGRVGGDEFSVLINTAVEDPEKFREYVESKCRELCEAFHNSHAGSDGKYKISASVGAALYPADGRSFEELYSACDKALYRSKQTGRDTFSFFDAADNDPKESEGEK